MNSQIHRIDSADNVAVALTALERGQAIRTEGGDLIVQDAIAFGHKVALRDVPAGSPVIKYGEPIGVASRDIRRGELVHVHNLESNRGRGDLTGHPSGDECAATGEGRE